MKEFTTRYMVCKLREQLDIALEYVEEIEERLVEEEEFVIRQRIKKGGLVHKFKHSGSLTKEPCEIKEGVV